MELEPLQQRSQSEAKDDAGGNDGWTKSELHEQDAAGATDSGQKSWVSDRVIVPGSSLDIFINILVAGSIIYAAFALPYRLAFGLPTGTDDLVLDILFIADLVRRFFTGFFDQSTHELITDKRRIAVNYLRGWFALDLVAALPLGIIFSSIWEGMNARIASQLKHLLRTVRLLRLKDMLSAQKIQTRIESTFRVSIDPIAVQFSGVGLIFSMSTQWLACLFVGIVPEDLPDGGNAEKFVGALYWTVYTLSTVGYGDIVATTSVGRIISIVAMLTGNALLGYLFANIGRFILALRRKDPVVADELENIRHSLIGSECLDALKNEIYHYCKLFPECLDASLRREAIDAMPADLVKAMLLESKMENIGKVRLVQDEHSTFVKAVARHIKPDIYSPGQVVLPLGALACEMFLLAEGTLEAFSQHHSLLGIFHSGAQCGEENFFCDSGVVEFGYRLSFTDYPVEVFLLGKEDLRKATLLCSENWTSIERRGKERLASFERLKRIQTEAKWDLDAAAILVDDEVFAVNDISWTHVEKYKAMAKRWDMIRHAKAKRGPWAALRVLLRHGSFRLPTRRKRPSDRRNSALVKAAQSKANLLRRAQSNRKRSQAGNSRLVVAPNGTTRLAWDSLFAVVLYFSIAFVVFQAAVLPDRRGVGIIATYSVIDACSILDICLNFSTGFFDESLQLVSDRNMIARAYMQGWFLIDVTATLLGLLSLFFLSFGVDTSVVLGFRVASLLRALRLVKIASQLAGDSLLVKLHSLRMPFTPQLFLFVIELAKLVFSICLVAHLFACTFFLLSVNIGEEWVDDDVFAQDISEAYISSLYFMFTTLSTVGYGDITPSTTGGRIFTILVMLMGTVTFGYFLASLGGFVASRFEGSEANDARTTQLKAWVSTKRLGKRTWMRCRDCIVSRKDIDTGTSLARTLHRLPWDLLSSLALEDEKLSEEFEAVRSLPANSRAKMLIAMREHHLAEGDFIVSGQGEGDPGFVFVKSGVIKQVRTGQHVSIHQAARGKEEEEEVYRGPKNDRVFAKGDVFATGHNPCLCQSMSCNVATLPKEGLAEIRMGFPGCAQEIEEAIRRHI